MAYQYKTVEIPASLFAKRKQVGAAAQILQETINQHAIDGFEFYRVDSFTVDRPMGCLSFGQTERQNLNVVTFRKEV